MATFKGFEDPEEIPNSRGIYFTKKKVSIFSSFLKNF